jgi:sec-independent protein translocase protein TatA
MPFINGGHIWLILALIVLLVIFGPGKLPELGSAVGKTIKAFRKSTEDLKAEMSEKDLEPAAESARIEPVRTEHSHASAGSKPARTEPIRADNGSGS